jgi:hypothetical protein
MFAAPARRPDQEPRMSTRPPSSPLDFLHAPPEPVAPAAHAGRAPPAADTLPAATVERLMRLPGVDGVWVERDASGQRVVVLHHSPPGPAPHLPRAVAGLPVRVVGGEPIRAGG